MKALLMIFVMGFGLNAMAELCSYEGPQAQMNHCAYTEFAESDAFLNVVWSNIKTCLGSNSQEYRAVLQTQRQWITFKEDKCAADAEAEWGNGSGWALGYYACLRVQTQKRVRTLISRFEDRCVMF